MQRQAERSPGRDVQQDVERLIAEAVARIRFGNVLIHIQDGVVVQIESTEKQRVAHRPAKAAES